VKCRQANTHSSRIRAAILKLRAQLREAREELRGLAVNPINQWKRFAAELPPDD